MPAYAEAEYWDQRYHTEPACFDWYLTYVGLEPLLKRYIQLDAKTLQLGVGTSLLQADMVERGGYQQILSIDISSVAIKHMQELHSRLPQLKYRIGDARSMPQYKDGSFDAIIDKGTLDSIMCGTGAAQDSPAVLEECYRLLRDGGVMLNITYAEPVSRVHIFQQLNWEVSFYILSKPQEFAAGAGAVGTTASCQQGLVTHGPVEVNQQTSLEAFSNLTSPYFVYVLKKLPPGQLSSTNQAAAGPALQKEAAAVAAAKGQSRAAPATGQAAGAAATGISDPAATTAAPAAAGGSSGT